MFTLPLLAGELTALMGPSGCGKTSLINTLLQRTLSTRVTGEIGINGETVTPALITRHVHYVMAFDTCMPYLTVDEILKSSAQLRLPNLPYEKQMAAADEVINWLKLDVRFPPSFPPLLPSTSSPPHITCYTGMPQYNHRWRVKER